MIEAKAVVVKVSDGRAWVEVSDRQDGCGRCDEPGGCRSIKMAYAVRPAKTVFSVPDEIGVREGEAVVLRMEDGAPLKGALVSYGLGAVCLIGGAAVGHGLSSGNDLFALIGAGVGLALAVIVNRLLHRSRRWRGALKMEMVRPETAACDQVPVRQL